MAECECGCGRTAIKRFAHGHNSRVAHPMKLEIEWEMRDMGYVTPCKVSLYGTNDAGYAMTNAGGGSPRRRHIIEWEAVHGRVPKGLELDHLCRVRNCIRVDHLEAVTHAENVGRGLAARLTADQVREIRTSRETGLALAARLGVCRSTVYDARNGKRYKWVT